MESHFFNMKKSKQFSIISFTRRLLYGPKFYSFFKGVLTKSLPTIYTTHKSGVDFQFPNFSIAPLDCVSEKNFHTIFHFSIQRKLVEFQFEYFLLSIR